MAAMVSGDRYSHPDREALVTAITNLIDGSIRSARSVAAFVTQDVTTFVCFLYLTLVGFLALFGPSLTPYQYDEIIITAEGGVARTMPPSSEHLLGTTGQGYDVLSRLMYGARPTAITGLVGGAIIISIGSTVGVTAGYFGGAVDNFLMRVTDFMYGVPLIPFAIVLLALFGIGFWTAIVVIGLILWRSSARVLRSQVLQIKERSYITGARAVGASHARIILKYILPNIKSMIVLLFSLGIGYAILVQASLAFIGVVDPFVPSWGVMLRNAYVSGQLGYALWWSIPPGFAISMTVLSCFMLGRKMPGVEAEEMARGGG